MNDEAHYYLQKNSGNIIVNICENNTFLDISLTIRINL